MRKIIACVLLALGILTACADQAPTPTTVAAAVAPTTATPAPCEEDEPCWNSCTMGNQTPCDLGATLPNGEFFELNSGASQTLTYADCGDRGTPTRVTVYVHTVDGAVIDRATTTWDWCLPGDVSTVDWSSLYRKAARKLA